MSESSEMPCPECRISGRGGRIGNRRSACGTCNAFAQRVMRMTRTLMKERHAQEYEALRQEAEQTLYPDVVAGWRERAR